MKMCSSHKEDTMTSILKPIARRLYKAWLRTRLDNYTRSLHAIAVQR